MRVGRWLPLSHCTSNVNQVIAKHALQTWSSSSLRSRSSLHLYNTYDHRWVPLSYKPAAMQGNFSIYMKKVRKRSPDRGGRGLDENDESGAENLVKMKSARPPPSINHLYTTIVECRFRTSLMTCKEIFPSVLKIRKRSIEKRVVDWMMDFHQVPDSRFTIFTKSPTPPIRGSFSDFFIQMENFPCMSSGPYESGIQRWSEVL